MALAPRTVQNMPDCLRREPITVFHPASMAPEPTNKCRRRNWGSACAGASRKMICLDAKPFHDFRNAESMTRSMRASFTIFSCPEPAVAPSSTPSASLHRWNASCAPAPRGVAGHDRDRRFESRPESADRLDSRSIRRHRQAAAPPWWRAARSAFSTASRPVWPLLRRSAKMRLSGWFASPAIS